LYRRIYTTLVARIVPDNLRIFRRYSDRHIFMGHDDSSNRWRLLCQCWNYVVFAKIMPIDFGMRPGVCRFMGSSKL
jgi:hypothetical protein